MLASQVLGAVGALPEVYSELEINFFLLRRLLGVRSKEGEKQSKVEKLAKTEVRVALCILYACFAALRCLSNWRRRRRAGCRFFVMRMSLRCRGSAREAGTDGRCALCTGACALREVGMPQPSIANDCVPRLTSFRLLLPQVLMLNIGSMCTGARVLAVKADLAKLQLTSPVCTKEGEKVALSRRVEKHWRLIGWGQIQKVCPHVWCLGHFCTVLALLYTVPRLIGRGQMQEAPRYMAVVGSSCCAKHWRLVDWTQIHGVRLHAALYTYALLVLCTVQLHHWLLKAHPQGTVWLLHVGLYLHIVHGLQPAHQRNL